MKRSSKKNDDAVSEVVGVIVMVALTVILAAIIAAFVFGLVGSLGKTKIVAATAVKPNTSAIEITYDGGQDASFVNSLNVSVADALSVSNMGGGSYPMTVGCSTTVLGNFTLQTHVLVIGNFNDGTQQVILNTYV